MPDLLTKSPEPPPVGTTRFSLDRWVEHRDRGIKPAFHSGYVDDDQNRVDFLTGAELMGLRFDPDAPLDEPWTIKPQQLQIVDTLAGGFDTYAVEIPRRASKTTTIFCLLLGRCMNRPGYQVTFAAQTGAKGTARLREWKTRLQLVNPEMKDDLPSWMERPRARPKAIQRQIALWGEELAPVERREVPEDKTPFKVMMGAIAPGIRFDNGSTFLVTQPNESSVRGDAADAAWLDEAQEIDPDEGDGLMAGILPMLDTKPGACIIVSGTAGEVRVGPFWKELAALREGDPETGGIDFAADPATPWESIEDETLAMELIDRSHPGIGTLTTVEKMVKNWRKLPKPQWAREYLSMWPETFGTAVIKLDEWNAEGISLEKKITKPRRVGFGLAIKPGGGVAAVAAAWRGANGQAYVEIADHKSGTDWLPEYLKGLSQRYPGSSIAYDDIAEGKATAVECERMKPKPRMRAQRYQETAAGAIMFMRELDRKNLRHFNQIGLNSAVSFAGKREVRGDSGVWLWTPAEPGADITCLDAATRALREFDQHVAKSTGAIKPSFG